MPEGAVILLSGQGEVPRIVFHYLRPLVTHVVMEGRQSRWELVARRLRRLGPARVAGQLAFQLGVAPLLWMSSRQRIEEIRREHGLRSEEIPSGNVVSFASVNDAACIDHLASLAPKVTVISGTRILSADLLGRLGGVVLNVHTGMTPRYRGVHGGYWALAEQNEALCGVTIHRVDAGIDTGPIVEQIHVRPTPRDNFVTYPYLQLATALPALKRAVEAALKGRLESRPSVGDTRLYSHPTIGQYLWNRYRWRVR